jgi:hypothetical protein
MANKKETKEELNPSEYFNDLKDKVQNITDEELVEFYQGCLSLVDKYKITGQKKLKYLYNFSQNNSLSFLKSFKYI